MSKIANDRKWGFLLFIAAIFLIVAPILSDESNVPVDKSASEPVADAEYCCDTPGDANHDGGVNIADCTYIVYKIFFGGADYPCPAEADANGDGNTGLVDAHFILNYIFFGGAAPICHPE